jgi:hypothetical protein
MSQLIQTVPYITAMARQTPTRGQDPSRRHFWMASLIMRIVVGTIACYWCSRINHAVITSRCSLSLESFYKSDNDTTAWLVVLWWRAKRVWHQLIWPAEHVTRQLNITARYVISCSITLTRTVCKIIFFLSTTNYPASRRTGGVEISKLKFAYLFTVYLTLSMQIFTKLDHLPSIQLISIRLQFIPLKSHEIMGHFFY